MTAREATVVAKVKCSSTHLRSYIEHFFQKVCLRKSFSSTSTIPPCMLYATVVMAPAITLTSFRGATVAGGKIWWTYFACRKRLMIMIMILQVLRARTFTFATDIPAGKCM